MRKLIVSQFVTLDGVMEAPEKWNTRYLNDKELTSEIMADFRASGSLLFGRTTFEFMAARWPSRTGAMAEQFNTLPKHVVSTTLKKADWNNSTVIKRTDEIQQLKSSVGKHILLFGSYQLLQTLMTQNLIDQYKIYVYPLTLGRGKRLFENGKAGKELQLVTTKVYMTGVVALTYETSRE